MLSIVIPFYNESDRFEFFERGISDFVDKWSQTFELVLVNDGSTDNTEALIHRYQEEDAGNVIIKNITLPSNRGKGAALKKGIALTTGQWILTLDADMSASPLILLDWLKGSDLSALHDDTIYIGSRRHEASKVKAKSKRRWLGHLFNAYTGFFIPLGHKDTQCGFKLYPAAIAKKLFGALEVLGWAHDIEILLRASYENIKIESLPVTWNHIGNEKIHVLSDGIKMAIESFRVRNRLSQEYADPDYSLDFRDES